MPDEEKVPKKMSDVEIECPHCHKRCTVKVFKQKVENAKYKIWAEVKTIQPDLFDDQRKKESKERKATPLKKEIPGKKATKKK